MPESVVNRLITGLAACVAALAMATVAAVWLGPATLTVMPVLAPVSQSPTTSWSPAMAVPTLGDLRLQMDAMQRIHDRVEQADDAHTRRALMPEHLIALQTGMAMLHAMPPAITDADAGSGDRIARPMVVDLPARSPLAPLHLELQFMQLLIQMMIDRLPAG